MTVGSNMSYDSAQARIRKRATKQLKQNTAEQLEKETKRMEDRIRALKEQMVKEKEEREKLGGTRWSSGKTTGAQQSQKKKPSKSDKGPRKIKILSDEPLSAYAPKKAILRESINETFNGPTCGQCERAKATLACNECTESYCVGCFMGFHKKGALRTHTTRNLDQYEYGLLEQKEKLSSRVPKADDRRMKPTHGHSSQQGNGSPEQKSGGGGGGALLRGTFNEDDSSASFAQALNEWRNTNVKDNTWVNPADAHQPKVQTTSCETSTGHEQLKPTDVKLNFGTNKSLTYMDRLVLKKHRDGNTGKPTNRDKGKKAAKREEQEQAGIDPQEEYGINYREIFQSIGAQTARGKSPLNGYEPRSAAALKDSRSVVIIEEVDDAALPSEESTCIVEEGGSTVDFGHTRPTSRTGCVSIMGMTATGDFRSDADDLQPSPPPGKRYSETSQSALGMRKPYGNTAYKRCQSASAVPRVWSPSLGYKGLSNFFLVGVDSESPRGIPKSDRFRTPSPPKRISPKILARGVWKPGESVCVVEDAPDNNNGELSKYPGGGPVIPFVLEPTQGALSSDSRVSDRRVKSKRDHEVKPGHMDDFGIVDFLRASPMPSKFSEDYYDVHRVSTVSPLSLTPKPPQLHWSDDDSDDDVILEVTSRMSMVEAAELEKEDLEADDRTAAEDQDADDKATLEDLTWELTSTTGGRLSHCEEDLDEGLDDGVGDSCEVDSIEDDPDTGSTCSLNDDHVMSLNSSDSMDEEERQIESRLMEREVQALE